ncbi:MAG TPA: translation initiation factor IF-2 [Chitinophagaceae bacterium]|nr:translation initiation factor IF-2 [Chitinophagaceae bacterium]HNE92521.1 translation initiation factor IF-2 [Chitinophagaceae bacterium]HNM33347.1 translation initiation factor IF-2 [Chitinophagaceae bacterium]HNN31033.1 translation initiation factor IF-2 [Chitinophagaceae bacterium]
MSELKLPRLLAAAKEFNIGQETLIDFLAKKGFNKDDLKPTAKLSEEMYYALQAEFQSDKAAKNKADQIEIPKSVAPDKKKKEEETVTKKVEKKAEEIKVEPSPIKEEPLEEKKPDEVKKVEVEVEKKIEQKTTATEIVAPKVVDKIDLSAIDSSTRPKKTAKAKTTEPTKEQPSSKKEETAKVEQQEPKVEPAITEETNSIVKPPDTASTIVENIEVEKLTGPKILGKITLPVDSDTRPKPISKVEQHKRKRIVVDKKPGSNIQRVDFRKEGGGQTQTGNNNRGGNQQQQNRFGGKPGGGGGHPQRGGGRNAGNNRGKQDNRRVADKEIDAKEIQDKIKETQAKLAGSGGRGKSLKAKYRREKRQEAAEAAMEGSGLDDNKLQVTEFVTVSELANLMDVSFTDVISKCMGLGLMVSINQRLDAEVIELVAGEFGFEAEFTSIDDVEDEEEDDEDTPENLAPRSPIVTIMGHVDHGKTSLLDYIRNASVVAGEAGGITQHIGAYEVTLANGKNITFLDTPGHEAFTAMRARGAKVTDIAVIVVAADDAVMPQTKEAISHAQAANVPMIFAVNKIDKDGANPQKIYEQLSQMNLLVESWGGKYQSQELSAKKGLHINELLEKILLEAELLELKANANREATGTIIEASLDKGRGYVATILVQNGTLKQGDIIVSGQYYGRIKAMFNERNQRVQEAPPSTPVVILGLNGAPQAGEKFKVYSDEAYAKDIATKRAQIIREQGLRARKHITLDEIGRRLALGNFKELNIIIKGDVDGSVEALSDSLQKLSTSEVAVNVVLKAVGQISESDVLLATASDAVLIGFNVRPSSQASKLAATEGVQIKQYSIIYTAIEEIKSAMEGMLEPKVEEKEVATVEIREVFRFDKAIVAGCYVTEGKIKRDHKIKVFRDGILVYPRQEGAYAELGSLKRFKDDVKEVNNNYECGLTVKGFTDIQAGDTVVAYEEEEIKRTL